MANEPKVCKNPLNKQILWKDGTSHALAPEIAGTLQFMAIEMLENCSNYMPGVGYPPKYEPFKRMVRHELESLVWVAEYALFRKAHQAVTHLPSTHATRKEVEDAFAEEFGCNIASKLVKQRRQTAFSPREKISPYLDEALQEFIPALMGLVKHQNQNQDLRRATRFWTSEMVAHEQELFIPMTCDSFEEVLRKYASVMKLF
ncbi:hypothetical protein PHLGIDRAFT_125539 [Phlebiopsis gigantea 11061_1 CR5-6]|uniref:Uncharacterized protein n=1 Tax=Phlebiopsis gigantea (strain 11061_1 CR5-6) TaxID=745531 RepID=A0A0C3PSV4_PHLG1|nr:hypothetical protein PHLGIDRAFT_125539 [Phlebiopsis gigantea 11061_1 CR5-6]